MESIKGRIKWLECLPTLSISKYKSFEKLFLLKKNVYLNVLCMNTFVLEIFEHQIHRISKLTNILRFNIRKHKITFSVYFQT